MCHVRPESKVAIAGVVPLADFIHEEEGEDVHCSDVLRTEVIYG